MGGPRLLELRTGTERRLAPFTTIGRDPSNLLHLDDASVSRAHAAIHWEEGAWWMRDLGSANGSTLNGRRLTSAPAALSTSDRVTFGKGEPWEVRSVAPPEAFAWSRKPPGELGASAGVLFLPGAGDAAPTTIYRNPAGAWVAERGDEVRPLLDGDWLEVDGRSWRLVLPDPSPRTHMPGGMNLASAVLHLTVSRDWEHVSLRLVEGDVELDLGELQCWGVVLLLAQERLRDQQGPEHDQGWLDIERIAKDLAMRRGTVDVAITRARQALAERGVLGAERIVVARRGQRRTGIGPGALVVHPVAP